MGGRTGSSLVVAAGDGDDVMGHSGSPQGSCSNGSAASSGRGQVPCSGHALPPAAADGSTDVADGAVNGAWGSNRSSSEHSEYSSHEVPGLTPSTTTSAGSECMHGVALHCASTDQAICMARYCCSLQKQNIGTASTGSCASNELKVCCSRWWPPPGLAPDHERRRLEHALRGGVRSAAGTPGSGGRQPPAHGPPGELKDELLAFRGRSSFCQHVPLCEPALRHTPLLEAVGI